MTSEQLVNEEEGTDIGSIISGTVVALERDLPDWRTMPVSALLMYIEDNAMGAREWAFKTHSAKHAEEWRERVKHYMSVPKVNDKLGITEVPEVRDEFAKYLMSIVGGSVGLIASVLDLVHEDSGTIDLEAFETMWSNVSFDPDRLTELAVWGGQSFTFVMMQIENQLRELRPYVLDYEIEIGDGKDVVTEFMYLILLGTAVILAIVMAGLTEEQKEAIRMALEEEQLEN